MTHLRLDWRGVIAAGYDVVRLREITGAALKDTSCSLTEGSYHCRVAMSASAQVEVRPLDGETAELRLYRADSAALTLQVTADPAAPAPANGFEYPLGERIAAAAPQAFAARLRYDLALRWLRSCSDSPFLTVPVLRGSPELQSAIDGDWTWLNVPLHPGRVSLEVHFPFLHRRAAKTWNDRLQDLQPSVDSAGRISIGAELPLSPTLLATATRTPATQTWTFQDTRTLDAPALHLHKLLEPHHLTLPDSWREGPLEVTFTLRLPMSAAAAWLRLPPSNTSHWRAQFTKISVAIQMALRAWMPYIFFQDPAMLKDRSRAWPMLVWESLRIYERRYSRQFAYDIMEPEEIERSLRVVKSALRESLRLLGQRLQSVGLHGLARKYSVRGSPALIDAMFRMPKLFCALLRGEATIIEDLQRLGEQARLLQQRLDSAHGAPIRGLHRKGKRLHVFLVRRLRRIFAGYPFGQLETLILMTATWTLARSQGQQVDLEAVLHLRRPGTSEEILIPGLIFYAKDPASLALSYCEPTSTLPPGRVAGPARHGARHRRQDETPAALWDESEETPLGLRP